ncbi:ParB family protein [Enterovibrio nigricans]|uniref:Chromosome partitioning protein, ParB family n=1 Tax=Enterovibrio nigricans DSM 22720 TaxID=1121868 RepID=A0A1T4W6C7_9GAMM|nr:ParB family protein [Enterovibrio nigricans]PKF48841.1 chromosome partitioning protein ParB [Enterovibrio nigricans]SKA72747.1 chromosome partitioning protein, ParB family [Enterovibrio nigricans DSM 22720]
MTKRKPIGRKLETQMLETTLSNATGREQVFVLASGEKASFVLQRIEAAELAQKTYVDMATNGRDQTALTEASVSDITRTLSLQQFFPAIGCEREDGKIEILDGSRRRAAALFVKAGLDALVTKDDISFDDARQLAADIQTAREHNLREVGMRLLALRDGGMNQKEIAENQRLSPAKVTRAIQAASVPADMLGVFPVQAELTHPDYKLLLELSTTFTEKGLDLAGLVAAVMVERDELDASLPADRFKDALLKGYKAAAAQQLSAPKKSKSKIEKLWAFSDKDTFARRKEKDRVVSYEFGRFPKSLVKDLDDAVSAVLEKHFNS